MTLQDFIEIADDAILTLAETSLDDGTDDSDTDDEGQDS